MIENIFIVRLIVGACVFCFGMFGFSRCVVYDYLTGRADIESSDIGDINER